MTTLRIYFTGESAQLQLQRSNVKNARAMNQAMQETAKETAVNIETRGRADIASGGRFGSRWTQGLHAKVSRGGANIRLAVTHDVPYFMVYERGALIAGRPLLWLPIGGGSKGGSAGQVYARNFPGRLFRITSKAGRPLLMDAVNKTPRYVGLASVRIPQKFHIRDIIRQEATRMKETYSIKFRQAASGTGTGSGSTPAAR